MKKWISTIEYRQAGEVINIDPHFVLQIVRSADVYKDLNYKTKRVRGAILKALKLK